MPPVIAGYLLVLGADDAAIPVALPDGATLTASMGGLQIDFTTGDDANIAGVQCYLGDDNILDREADIKGAALAVEASRAYVHVLGDATRQTLISNGGFSSTDAWTLNGGWAISTSKARHTAGSVSSFSQPVTVETGAFYRIALTVNGATAGTVTAKLTGGSTLTGTALSGNGLQTDRIQVVTGNDTLLIEASADFDGNVDTISFYKETDTCLPQGTRWVWIEPQNEDEAPGPVSGPFEIELF